MLRGVGGNAGAEDGGEGRGGGGNRWRRMEGRGERSKGGMESIRGVERVVEREGDTWRKGLGTSLRVWKQMDEGGSREWRLANRKVG